MLDMPSRWWEPGCKDADELSNRWQEEINAFNSSWSC